METCRQDRRIARTLRNLDEALMQLLEEKPMSQISVTELCERADINRNTFYCHYTNPNEVLKQLEDRLLEKTGDSLKVSSSSEDITETVLKVLYQNRKLAKTLLSDNAASDVTRRIFDSARKRAMVIAREKGSLLNETYQEMMSEFSLAGGHAVVKLWANSGMRQPPADIAKFIRLVSNYGTEQLQMDPDPAFRVSGCRAAAPACREGE